MDDAVAVRATSVREAEEFGQRFWPQVDRADYDMDDSSAWRAEQQAFGAYHNGVLIGTAVGQVRGGAAHLREVLVAPEWRNRKVGAALLRAFETWAGARRCHKLTLRTLLGGPAQRFYERHGWEVEAVLRRDWFQRDFALMAKWPLAPPYHPSSAPNQA
jgi:GNAT superfamily N-acetyltransferase